MKVSELMDNLPENNEEDLHNYDVVIEDSDGVRIKVQNIEYDHANEQVVIQT